MIDSVIEKIRTAPTLPGVYLFKNRRKHIIYVGKASNLKNRLASYTRKDDRRQSALISHTSDIDVIITRSDTEALTLEESLIKLHKPRYNVRLKDDKKFPYLKLTVQEEFPRIIFTRDIRPDGSLLFGPYTNARALRQTRDALCRIFKLVSCTRDLTKKYKRPCLEFNLGRCSAPCTDNIGKDEYAELVNKATEFLKGKSTELEKRIEKTMWHYADKENFEAAAPLRNQLFAIRRISQRQQTIEDVIGDLDVIGISRSRASCAACLFRIREQRCIAKEIFHLKITPLVTEDEITSAFIRLIYTHVSFMPGEIVVKTQPREWDTQSRWFKEKGFTVKTNVPKRGVKKRLLIWAEHNATNELTKQVTRARVPAALIDLQNRLHLETVPRRVEAFDISNLRDKFAVGSSVAFLDGRPYKHGYRRYRIKRVKGQNDFAMINEIVARRCADLKPEKHPPDLWLIDGGKGQLSAALHAAQSVMIDIPVFALAKRFDELYDCQGNVISLPPSSSGFMLLKRIRDEAHRFAIQYHRKVRRKSFAYSALESISGIGNTRKLALLRYFGSIDALKKASEEDIAKVTGIGRKIARTIYEALHM
jgi:excinuclease ABC subunit C